MRRTAACLGLGAFLWAMAGAVRGATYWQVSANGYLGALAVAGAAFGLVWPGTHLRTGALLVLPGLATLLTAGLEDYPDGLWWLVTSVIGGYAAAGSHWVAVELRTYFAAPRRGR